MFESADYLQVRKPLLSAQTLPPHCYTAEAFFQKEISSIFRSSWHFVCRTDQLKQKGDYLLVDTLVGSALVCRDGEGNINGFINACRHRGTRLKNEAGHCRHFVCPYHGWSFGLDGHLVAAPEMNAVQNFCKNDYGLLPVRLETWGGFVFINFDNRGPELMHWLGNLPDYMNGHQPEAMRCTKTLEFTIESNWKILIENAVEAYHTGIVHRDSLGSQRSSAVDASGEWDALFVHSDIDKSIATLPGEAQRMPFISSLGEDAKSGTWFTVIYPCTQIVFSQDCIWWLDFKPLSVGRTHLTLGGCFPQSTISLEQFDKLAEPYYQRWSTATKEDNAIAEAQYKGLLSLAKMNEGEVGDSTAKQNLSGRFSPREHCVHALDNWVLDRVIGD